MNTPTAHTSSRINPDSKVTLWLTVVLIGSLGLTSFMVSFNGLRDVAAWVGLPMWMRWAVPVFIDIAILAYSLAAVIHKSRAESVKTTWITLGVFTATSVVANAAHALSVGEGETAVQRSIGAVIAALAPIAVFAATEELSRLAFSYQPTAQTQLRLTPAEDTSGHDETFTSGEPTVQSSPQDAPVLAVSESTIAHSEAEPEQLPLAVALAPAVEDVPAHSVQQPQAAEEQEIEKTSPERQVEETTSADSTGEEDEELARWVTEQIQAGNKLTGKSAGDFLGLSARTGRNRLNKLRESSPELFEGEQA